jgi:hydrogenase maturation factor HypE
VAGMADVETLRQMIDELIKEVLNTNREEIERMKQEILKEVGLVS